jgi:hypothetical protein
LKNGNQPLYIKVGVFCQKLFLVQLHADIITPLVNLCVTGNSNKKGVKKNSPSQLSYGMLFFILFLWHYAMLFDSI